MELSLISKNVIEVHGNHSRDLLCLPGGWEIKMPHNFTKYCLFGTFYFWIYSLPHTPCLLSELFKISFALLYCPQGLLSCAFICKQPASKIVWLPWLVYPRSLKNKYLEKNIIFRNDCTYDFPVLSQILLSGFADIPFPFRAFIIKWRRRDGTNINHPSWPVIGMSWKDFEERKVNPVTKCSFYKNLSFGNSYRFIGSCKSKIERSCVPFAPFSSVNI